MTALELLDRLIDLDVRLWLEESRIRFSAPDGVMTPELIATVVEHKPEIIEILRRADGAEAAQPTQIERVPRDGELPLSYSQQGLWIQDQLEPGTPAYNIPGVLRLRGRLDVARLEESLNQVVARHEALRSRFPAVDGQPRQIIENELWLPLHRLDIGHLDDEQLEPEVARLAAAEVARPFDLAAGPLVRLVLLRLSELEHVLLLTMHHIVADGWSIGVFFREMALQANALDRRRQDQLSQLPPLPVQYADFAAWQREWLQGPEAEQQIGYWLERLADAPRALDLPSDRPRPAVRTNAGAVHFFSYPRSLQDRLIELSRKLGATLYMTLLAAFKALLLRYTGQPDLVVGSMIAQRNREELEHLIGFFVNTVVLRTDLGGDPTFREVVARARDTILGSQANQSIPFDVVVERLKAPRDPSRSPLFQVMFILQNAPIEVPRMPGIELEVIEPEREASIYDLFFSMIQGDDGFTCEIEYSTELFDLATMKRLAGHFRAVLEAMLESPDRTVSSVPLLGLAELDQVTAWEQGRPGPDALELCLHELISEQAARSPGQPAVSAGGRTLSYGELERRSNQLAHHLRRLGAGAEQIVGLYMDRSPELIVAALGVLKAGAAYVALDPTSPPRRVQALVDEAGASVVITQAHLKSSYPLVAERAPEGVSSGPWLVTLEPGWSPIDSEPEEPPLVEVHPDNLANLVFTSGSTGRPKAVMVQHRGLVNAARAWSSAYGLGTEVHCHLQMASFTFDVFTGDLIRALTSGGRLVLCPHELRLEPEGLLELIRNERVDCVELVPVVLRVLIEHLELTGQRLDGVRLLICGSDVWYAGEYRRSSAALEPGARMVNSFGVTEATIDTTYFEGELSQEQASTQVPIGLPFANMKVHVLDERLGRCPIGVPGELVIGGDSLARGYAGKAELTAERFIPDPYALAAGERLYRTGDLARWRADGGLDLLGRVDAQVKVRGFRIELGEIETVLADHPGVREAVAMPRGAAGDGVNTQLVAYLVPAGETAPSAAELREHLGQALPAYMVPSAFMTLERLPLTASGKVDRKALPEIDAGQLEAAAEVVAPRTPIEQGLADLWSEVLGLERVGVTTSFFELGGNSLLATQVISRTRDAFGAGLDLRSFMSAPTVAEMARLVEQTEGSASSARAVEISLDDFDEETI